MRLVCPKCNAQYDIADDVIPEGGRDVQCSNCTHTWFQTDKPKTFLRTTPILTPTTPTNSAQNATAPGEHSATPSRPEAPTRKPLDSSIVDILREEASQSSDLATHPAPVKTMAESATSALNEADDKATETNAQRSEATRMRISRMTEQAQAASENGESSRNQRTIPDIDEINASLNARHTANKIPELTEAELESAMKRRGFRRGFAMVIILFAISIMPYVFASEIVEQFPETREYMVQYVDTVEQLRVQLREAAVKISALIEDLIPSDTATATETTPVEPAADPVASTDG